MYMGDSAIPSPFEQLGTALYATEPQTCPIVIMTRTRMEINTQWLRHLYFIVRQSINTLLSGILHFITSAMKRGIERNVWLNRYIVCKKKREHFSLYSIHRSGSQKEHICKLRIKLSVRGIRDRVAFS